MRVGPLASRGGRKHTETGWLPRWVTGCGIRIRQAGHRSSSSAQQAPPARVVLVGTGEVTRCLAVHGAGRVRAAVLAAPLRPFSLNMDNSPEGAGRSDFDAPLAGTGTHAAQSRQQRSGPYPPGQESAWQAAKVAIYRQTPWRRRGDHGLEGYPAIRSNSLPSMSAKVVQRDLPDCWSQSLRAPRLSRRSLSLSKV
jgi:hypothetical protein